MVIDDAIANWIFQEIAGDIVFGMVSDMEAWGGELQGKSCSNMKKNQLMMSFVDGGKLKNLTFTPFR